MHNILLQIIKKKQQDVNSQKRFKDRFTNKILKPNYPKMAIIAEIKLASPTMPSLGKASDIFKRAILYEKANVDAISFITEKHYFKGSTDFISKLKTKVNIPILQKDFVIDKYQIYEAKIIGSDAILLIARLVSKNVLKSFVSLCQQIGIEPVVEINNQHDLEKAIDTTASFIAVNARDLQTFAIDINKACSLMKEIPDKFIKLGFSGIQSSDDIKQYKKAGAKGVLIGTSLMRATNISDFINSLRNI